MNKILSGMRAIGDAQISRPLTEKFKTCARSRKRKSDEGALLVEVLVGMLILVVVFTATTIALSGMSEQRVRVEQRDRALALASSYDELSRTFKCGFVVDRISDSLTVAATGQDEFRNKVENCDFRLKDGFNPGYTVARNAGDQSFTKRETLNRTGTSFQEFEINIRYWFERAGTGDHAKTCPQISVIRDLPIILTRLISVSWTEKSVTRVISIVKRDPVPADNVVFALGNRVNILVNKPSSVASGQEWSARLNPYPAQPNLYIEKINDESNTLNIGQPDDCIWYPYITPDGPTIRRVTTRNAAGGLIGSNDVSVVLGPTLETQGSVPVAP